MIIALGESIVALGVGAADEPVSAPLVTAVVLGLGVSVALWWAYFDVVAPVAFRLRNVHSVNKQRVVTALVLVALLPVAWQLPALAALGLLAAVLVTLIGYESTVHAEARHAVRHAEGPH